MNSIKTLSRILALTSSMALTGYSQSFLTNGLVAYYPFNGNANDVSGNSNDCVQAGGVSYGTDRFGNPSQCLQLNGVDAYVTTTNMPLLNNSFSYTGWIKVDGNSPWEQSFAAYGVNDEPTTGVNQLWNFTYDPPNSRWDFWDRNQTNWQFSVTPSRDPTQNWTFVAVVYGAGNSSTFVNGVLESRTSVALPLPVINNRRFTIGASYPVLLQAFNGRVDDVRIYNRALSPAEVQQLYLFEAPDVVSIRKAVYLTSPNLRIGTNYQLQVSSDLNNWTNFGSVFTATTNFWRTANYWDVDNWDQLFFRLQTVP